METFQKRQKEMRRLERQKDKEARRLERKKNRGAAGDGPPLDEAPEAPADGPPEVAPNSSV